MRHQLTTLMTLATWATLSLAAETDSVSQSVSEPQLLPLEAMCAEARRIEEDSIFTAKGHFEAARSWSRVHYGLGIPAAALAAIAGGSAFANHPLWAGSLAIVVSALVAVVTFLNPQERAKSHHLAGVKFNSLRQQARVFREVDLGTQPLPADARHRLGKLTDTRGELSLANPQIPRRAFERARRGIEQGEASYAIDGDQPR